MKTIRFTDESKYRLFNLLARLNIKSAMGVRAFWDPQANSGYGAEYFIGFRPR